MDQSADIVATKREALGLLGIREASLVMVENAAGIEPQTRRTGYTAEELRRLVTEVRKALGR